MNLFYSGRKNNIDIYFYYSLFREKNSGFILKKIRKSWNYTPIHVKKIVNICSEKNKNMKNINLIESRNSQTVFSTFNDKWYVHSKV